MIIRAAGHAAAAMQQQRFCPQRAAQKSSNKQK
jgi:hypothetical protein